MDTEKKFSMFVYMMTGLSFQATKQEIVDLQEEHVKERQELEQTQMELTRELKLKVLIIENFIPPEEKAKVNQRIESKPV